MKFFNDKNIKVKDIACGIRHSVALSETGDIYTWGRGEYGLLGNGSNRDSMLPTKNEYFEMYMQESPNNTVIKIDCADEYTGALTKGGVLYVWGKNNQGQLGIGSGIGIDITESEKFPTPVLKPKELKYVDFSCGDNTMMMLDDHSMLHKTGFRIDYSPSIFQITKVIKPKMFWCGNRYYCMVDGNILYLYA